MVVQIDRGAGAMKLRITTQQRQSGTVVRVDGELVDAGVPELQKTCAAIAGPIAFDLAGLDRLDLAGLQFLHRLSLQGACLLGANPYISLLLREHADSG